MTTNKDFPPLKVNCFHCQKKIVVKYVYGFGNYSHKNNWGYWTRNEEYKDNYICDDCLVKLYQQHKWEFRQLISDKKKQATLRQYLKNGMINGQTKAIFIINKSNINGSEKKLPLISKKKKTIG